MFFKIKEKKADLIKLSIRDREKPLTKKDILDSLALRQPVSQVVKSNPRKEYSLDRLNRRAERMLRQLRFFA